MVIVNATDEFYVTVQDFALCCKVRKNAPVLLFSTKKDTLYYISLCGINNQFFIFYQRQLEQWEPF